MHILISPFRPGEGATFPGGPGRLPLKLAKVASGPDGSWLIEAGEFRYFLDARSGAIAAAVGGSKVAYLRPSVPLTRVGLKRRTPTDVVVANEFLTIGFHADGLMVLVPHKVLALRLHSLVASPELARLDAGRLHLPGSKGGLCIAPEAPLAPARPPAFEVLTPKKPLETDTRGWEARWRAAPGQRLGVGLVGPPGGLDSDPVGTPQVLSSTAGDLGEQISAARGSGQEALVRVDVADYAESAAYLRVLRFARLSARADGIVLAGLDPLPWPDAYTRVRQAREVFPGGKILLPPAADEDVFPLPSFVTAYTDGVLRLG
jgi:hypothetical protein